MEITAEEQLPIVSAKTYADILTSERLRRMLLPDGLVSSPYKITNYQATLTLEDPEGAVAAFQRSQEVRFLQDGVSGILDHMWGDGVPLTFYHNEAGRLEDSFRDDEGRRHLVIGLKREMAKGEDLKFEVVRRAMAQFTSDEEWLETILDHPVDHLAYDVVFPVERPCRYAVLCSGGVEVPLPVEKLANGRSLVRFDVRRPGVNTPYTVRWLW